MVMLGMVSDCFNHIYYPSSLSEFSALPPSGPASPTMFGRQGRLQRSGCYSTSFLRLSTWIDGTQPGHPGHPGHPGCPGCRGRNSWASPVGSCKWDITKLEDFTKSLWVWVNTYRYIFSGMNIHLPAILGFTRYQGFDPSPYQSLLPMIKKAVHPHGCCVMTK